MNGTGEIRVISLAEQVRRQALEVLSIRETVDSSESLSALVDDLSGFALNFARNLPFVARNAVPRFIKTPPSVSTVMDCLRDAQRMIERIFSGSR